MEFTEFVAAFSKRVNDLLIGKSQKFNGKSKNLVSELNRQGLSIRSITPDGNCLFR